MVTAFALLMHQPHCARAESRLALVIGNGGYTSIPRLKNPPADVEIITNSLKQIGFEIISAVDLDGKAMRRAIREYTSKLRSYGRDTIGVLYYAGHGLQVRENNFLLPIDVDIKKESDAAIEAVHLNDIISALYDAENRMNIVILDACRDNPFKKSLRVSASGLSGFDAPAGTLIAFSTAPGKVALDGVGSNSPYARALATALIETPQSIESAFKRTRERVYLETNKAQVPWESSSLIGEFMTAAASPPVRTAETSRQIAPEPSEAVSVPRSPIVSNVDPDGRLAYFVEWKYLGGESGAVPLGMESYADIVDYYGNPKTPRRDVEKDKKRYYDRWPNRRYKMLRQTLSMTETAPGFYDIAFEYTFDVENDQKRTQGRGNASLLLKRQGNSYLVYREAGDVLDRQTTEKSTVPLQ